MEVTNTITGEERKSLFNDNKKFLDIESVVKQKSFFENFTEKKTEKKEMQSNIGNVSLSFRRGVGVRPKMQAFFILSFHQTTLICFIVSCIVFVTTFIMIVRLLKEMKKENQSYYNRNHYTKKIN